MIYGLLFLFHSVKSYKISPIHSHYSSAAHTRCPFHSIRVRVRWIIVFVLELGWQAWLIWWSRYISITSATVSQTTTATVERKHTQISQLRHPVNLVFKSIFDSGSNWMEFDFVFEFSHFWCSNERKPNYCKSKNIPIFHVRRCSGWFVSSCIRLWWLTEPLQSNVTFVSIMLQRTSWPRTVVHLVVICGKVDTNEVHELQNFVAALNHSFYYCCYNAYAYPIFRHLMLT